jgi:hypothetical protein
MSGEGLDGGEDDEEIDEVAEVFAKWDFDADKSLNAGELKHGLNLAAGIVPDVPEEFYNVKRPDEYGRVIDPETMKTLTDDEASATDLGANPDELFALVRAGDEKEVALWLQRHNLPDGGVNDGTCSPLHVSLERFDKAVQHLHLGAIQGNYSAVALVLIDKGADLRHECEGISPLIRAVFARCLPVVRRILGLYADKSRRAKSQSTTSRCTSRASVATCPRAGEPPCTPQPTCTLSRLASQKFSQPTQARARQTTLMRERGLSWRLQLPQDERGWR